MFFLLGVGTGSNYEGRIRKFIGVHIETHALWTAFSVMVMERAVITAHPPKTRVKEGERERE